MAHTYAACQNCNQINKVPTEWPAGRKPVCGACKQELALHGAVSEATASGLGALIRKSPLPVVADFWAPWCGPCRQFAPTFEQAARELAGQYVFVKVNTEAQPLAGQTYGVRSIPTLAIFRGGLEVDRVSGAMPMPMFRQWLQTRGPAA